MREEILDRDRTPRRDDRPPRVRPRRDRRVLEVGYEPAHRIVERELPFLDERHHRDARQRLGLRRNAEDGVGRHLSLGLSIRPAEGALVDRLAVLEHQRDGAGDLRAIHGTLHHRIDPR